MTGATTLDSTGQYLPLNNPNNSMALGGPLQGHLIGVSTFTNSGIRCDECQVQRNAMLAYPKFVRLNRGADAISFVSP